MTASDQHRRIHAALRDIPAGRVVSYGRLAARAGIVRGARIAVAALRHAPDDAALPWHRVLRADGRIGFPPDHPLHAEQVHRLRSEGVVVTKGRVRMSNFADQAHDSDGLLLQADEPPSTN